MRCNVNGQWKSVCDKTLVEEPLCVAQPCPEQEVTDDANAKTITYTTGPVSEHYNEGTKGKLTECEERYVPLSGKDEAVCDAGTWSIQLECIATCQEDVIIKGKKIIGPETNSTVEDLIMTKEEVLAKHCTPSRVEDRKLFEEGKT